jgi:hypothetical protein
MQQAGISGEGDRLGLNSGVDDHAGEVGGVCGCLLKLAD